MTGLGNHLKRDMLSLSQTTFPSFLDHLPSLLQPQFSCPHSGHPLKSVTSPQPAKVSLLAFTCARLEPENSMSSSNKSSGFTGFFPEVLPTHQKQSHPSIFQFPCLVLLNNLFTSVVTEASPVPLGGLREAWQWPSLLAAALQLGQHHQAFSLIFSHIK